MQASCGFMHCRKRPVCSQCSLLLFEKKRLTPRACFFSSGFEEEKEDDADLDVCLWFLELRGDFGKGPDSVSDGLTWELYSFKGGSPPILCVAEVITFSAPACSKCSGLSMP